MERETDTEREKERLRDREGVKLFVSTDLLFVYSFQPQDPVDGPVDDGGSFSLRLFSA